MRRHLVALWRCSLRAAGVVPPLHRRAALVVATLLISLGWVAAAEPDARFRSVDAVFPQVVAGIRAGRPAGYPIGGIDISGHDHRNFQMGWRTEVAAGSQFVYIKATEGTGYVNPHFATDYADAKAAKRYVGAYVYARPDLGDAVGQAEHFLAHAGFTRDEQTLVPFVDLEWPYRAGTDDCYNLKPAQMRAWIRDFIDRIEAGIGRKVMIYTNTYWWNPCTGNDASYGDHPLNIANYTGKNPRLPAGWRTFALWQYTAGDPTKPHSHDRDVVNGGMAGLQALAWPSPAEQRPASQ
jgi:GH25 family lysozyme M1 (1,4-beta-N-acetylmuramidase)